MKTKLLFRKNRIIGVIPVILGIVGLSLVFQGCEKDLLPDNTEILDDYGLIEIHGDLDDVNVLLDVNNRVKYNIAVNRILSLAIQDDSTILFNTNSGADINICEQLYNRITRKTTELIESGNYLLIEENGKSVIVPKNFIRFNSTRLKSSSYESGGTRIYIGYGCNEAQAVIDGFTNYGQNTTLGHMNQIWNMDSRNWGTAAQNIINTHFTIGGYSGSVQLSNGCFYGDNNCSGNIINNGHIQWDSQTNSGLFVLDDCQGLPLAVIRMYGYDAFQFMNNLLGW